jgi:hypothetical protein
MRHAFLNLPETPPSMAAEEEELIYLSNYRV